MLRGFSQHISQMLEEREVELPKTPVPVGDVKVSFSASAVRFQLKGRSLGYE